MEIEKHPLEPFLPAKTKLLMLGSFPPQKKTLVHGLLLPESE